jgi:tetratricopeptide (TPR) repeat protein
MWVTRAVVAYVRTTHMMRFPLIACTALLPLWIMAAFLVLAFGVARADLPREAQTAVDQGLAAIQKQDFAQANQCLQSACKKAPAADVYVSLGQAEAKIPGREMRAICWLGAYLAARPTAPDAAAVRSEIDSLQAKSRAKILAVIQSAEDVVRQMPSGEDRDRALQRLASIWESWGDETRAQKVIDLIDGPSPKSDALSNLATAYAEKAGKQFEAGDLPGSQVSLVSAQKAAQQQHDMYPRSESFPQYRIAMAHLTIARQEIRTGDITGAHASMAVALGIADSINDEWCSETKAAIATTEIGLGRVHLKSGDTPGSRESFAHALKLADFVQRPNEKYELLMDMADAQTKAGDLEGARASLVAALPLVTVYNDAGHARMEIVRAQVKAGDLVAAKKTADLIVEGEPSWKYDARRAIAEGQIRAHDLDGARKSLVSALAAVELYKNNGQGKFEAQRMIADAQIRAGATADALVTLATASKTADLLFGNSDQKSWAQQGIAEAQFKAGDKSSALKTASLIQNADVQSKTMSELAGSPNSIASIYSEPLEFPRQSEMLDLSSTITADAWIWMLHESFDAPWFTAYPDFSNYMAMADLILKTPVKNGMQRRYHPMDNVSSLIEVSSCMATAQNQVDEMLKLQFKK